MPRWKKAGSADAGPVTRLRMASSAVAGVTYDAGKKLLTVEYRGGGLYAYVNVTKREFDALRRAESAGEYVNQRIKPEHAYTLLKRSPPPR